MEYPPPNTRIPDGATPGFKISAPSGGSASSTASSSSSSSSSTSKPTGVIPVQLLQAYYQQLPFYGHQQIAIARELPYTIVNAVNHVATKTAILTVPTQRVAVIVDFFGYAVAPSPILGGAPVQLASYQLSGLIRFVFKVGDSVPLDESISTMSPYALLGSALPLQTGWSFLDTPVGPRRTVGFALYARAGQTVSYDVVYEDVPQFPLLKIGLHVHGFTTSERDFERFTAVNKLG